jgi:ribonuclease VapC
MLTPAGSRPPTLLKWRLLSRAQTRAGGSRQFDASFRRAGIVIKPVTERQTHIARQAYTDFGKGRHRAGLNFGDCFAYALAKTTGETLLFKGEDFKKTDTSSAI